MTMTVLAFWLKQLHNVLRILNGRLPLIKKVGHKLIRRVSLDKFYALVTGEENAFYQMCMVLPSVIEKAVMDFEGTIVPHDTVIDELREMASKQDIDSEDMAIAMAAYIMEDLS